MNDTEFDIIDELYFVTAFSDLQQTLGLPPAELCQHLQDLVQKGYLKCFYPDPDTEADLDPATFPAHCQQYYFLATKAGLLAHNSR